MVVWIIGLSGAGKTTLANEVVAQVRQIRRNVVLLDGDVVREMFGNDLGHSMEDRRINAQRICQLGKFLENQGIDVVCAILSLFPENREWNRQNLKKYYEVFIDAPLVDLVQRDPKGLYGRYNKGEIRNVAGLDIEFPRPENADLTIHNIGAKEDLLAYARAIVRTIVGTGQ
ncbi:MAG: adenylyl-sulfate kinase [Halothiobacillaceae bacterium]|nr:adenylyl-sulfate kinase [Halothiobacillaceae bacterium]